MDVGRGSAPTDPDAEYLIQDRLRCLEPVLRAQTAKATERGINVHSAKDVVSPEYVLRANAARHSGFHEDTPISKIPLSGLRRRQRGGRRGLRQPPVAAGGHFANAPGCGPSWRSTTASSVEGTETSADSEHERWGQAAAHGVERGDETPGEAEHKRPGEGVGPRGPHPAHSAAPEGTETSAGNEHERWGQAAAHGGERGGETQGEAEQERPGKDVGQRSPHPAHSAAPSAEGGGQERDTDATHVEAPGGLPEALERVHKIRDRLLEDIPSSRRPPCGPSQTTRDTASSSTS